MSKVIHVPTVYTCMWMYLGGKMHTQKLLSNIKPAQGKMHHKLVENAMTAGTRFAFYTPNY